tara:strand:- start:1963 stop:2928 length:966 start_codon:yes stop_codon:yes gene_type:complete
MKSSEEIKKIAKKCIENEVEEINSLIKRIDNSFVEIINILYKNKGRVIFSGIGKSADIARKIVATLNSTGQPSIFLHAADAIHGDLGNIKKEDIIVIISNSGNTDEIKNLLPLIKNMGNQIISMTGNINSYLALESNYVIDVGVSKEACPNNLAPTTSTTVQLVMGDAIAISLLACRDFTDKDFARFHPGGSLGKKLNIRLSDLKMQMTNPKVSKDTLIKNIIIEISKNRVGATVVIDNNFINGIITDGDLRRAIEDENDFFSLKASDIMTKKPMIIEIDCLAFDALRYMQKNNISQLIVTENKKYIGIIHIHEIIKKGIV